MSGSEVSEATFPCLSLVPGDHTPAFLVRVVCPGSSLPRQQASFFSSTALSFTLVNCPPAIDSFSIAQPPSTSPLFRSAPWKGNRASTWEGNRASTWEGNRASTWEGNRVSTLEGNRASTSSTISTIAKVVALISDSSLRVKFNENDPTPSGESQFSAP